MLFSIITQYSSWYLIICLLFGFGIAFLLYYKDQKFIEISKKTVLFMALLRGFSISIISFLLLSPFFQITKEKISKPVIIIATDNSESILLNKDSAFYRTTYPEKLKTLVSEISEKYEVKTIHFGNTVKDSLAFNYKGKGTDFNSLFEKIKIEYINRNVGAIILATDGIYTQGNSSYFAFEKNKIDAPVYSIALGDTMRAKDLLIKEVEHNKVVYMGAKFPLSVAVTASFYKGEKYTLSVAKNGIELYSEQIMIDNQSSFIKHNIYLEPDEIGIQEYNISLSKLKNELTYDNNQTSVVVEILKNKKKVLMLFNAPHPDISVITKAIESNINYEVETVNISKYTKNSTDYNLVIAHQIPSNNTLSLEILEEISKNEIPVLHLLTQNSNINQFSKINGGLNISANNAGFDEVTALLNDNFSLFEVSEDLKSFLHELPPLYVPYGKYKFETNHQIFATQKLGNTSTGNPLIAFFSKNGVQQGVICGEGLWRWKIHNFKTRQNNELFNEFINKIIVYLSLKEKKEQFRIKTNAIFSEDEPIIFNAELYNDSYELINSSEVKLTIKDSIGNIYPFTFGKTLNAYTLNVGNLPVGKYNFTAETELNSKEFRKTGIFRVQQINVESKNTIAQHNDLTKLSQQSGGEMFLVENISSLASSILKSENIVSISSNTEELTELIELKWIFILLFLLLATEWFLRKYYSSY
ncbi:MAG: hypothetical protein IPO21_04190 [Bacteroidales bacterium]|nr:hypothetical protein [Bacteroidales bacterium]